MRKRICYAIILFASICLIACEDILIDDFPQTWRLVEFEPGMQPVGSDVVMPEITIVFTENQSFIKTTTLDSSVFEEGGIFELDGRKKVTLIYDRFSISEHYEISNRKLKADFRSYDGPKVVYERID